MSFKNTVIIMTSNVGSRIITANKKMGFLEFENSENIDKDVLKEAQENFKPEFLNRIDEIIVFQKLKLDEMKQIVNIMLNRISKRMEKKNIEINFDNNINEFIINQMENDNMGARPIRRLIQTMIEDKIAGEYLEGNIKEGSKIKILEESGKVYVKI